jgi:hypothetical protein
MLCNTTIIRYLNKPTQSKTQLTQEVVNSFNTYYTLKRIKCGYLAAIFLRTKKPKPASISISAEGSETDTWLT